MRLYFSRITIIGREHLLHQGACILAPKHCSRWDPLILALLQPAPLRFMTNANQFAGIQGWFIRRLGGFAVNLNRLQPSCLRHCLDLLVSRQTLVLFPEGGIQPDRLRPLKSGLARITLQAEALTQEPVPIIPIALGYQPAAQFRAQVCIYICPPLLTAEIKAEIYDPNQDSSDQAQEPEPRAIAQAVTQQLQQSLEMGLEQVKRTFSKQ